MFNEVLDYNYDYITMCIQYFLHNIIDILTI